MRWTVVGLRVYRTDMDVAERDGVAGMGIVVAHVLISGSGRASLIPWGLELGRIRPEPEHFMRA